jgi:mannose-1-phosphate guanylyltransferase
VGGWTALTDRLAADETGNRVRGRLACLDAEDNLVFCEDREETVMLIGVKGLVVVRAGGRTLIVPRERAEEVKKLAEKIES